MLIDLTALSYGICDIIITEKSKNKQHDFWFVMCIISLQIHIITNAIIFIIIILPFIAKKLGTKSD